MAQTGRPLSPHLQVYKWQVQMVTSILHRATGIINAVGSLIIVWGLASVAAGPNVGDLVALSMMLLGGLVTAGATCPASGQGAPGCTVGAVKGGRLIRIGL